METEITKQPRGILAGFLGGLLAFPLFGVLIWLYYFLETHLIWRFMGNQEVYGFQANYATVLLIAYIFAVFIVFKLISYRNKQHQLEYPNKYYIWLVASIVLTDILIIAVLAGLIILYLYLYPPSFNFM